MAEKKKTTKKRDKCVDSERVLTRLKESEEKNRIKFKELTEKVLPMYAQMEDLTKKVIAFDAQVKSNENIFTRIKQRLGL
tara:strand:- start:42 stop:281 length:240 start_codon:yes stop_codon:yes gene_type:complete